jgi:adenosylcobinamide-GDP ribazoletransferase
MRGLRAAVAFLTPLGGAVAPVPGALPWFGVVGALVGAGVGFTWWGAAQLFALPVAGALAVVADLALTGMLHVDGLADSADGLLPPLPAERRLAVMADPRSGAFAVVAVGAVLLVRFAVLSTVFPEPRTILAVAALWSTARTAMAVAACTVPYARPGGLASAFLGRRAAPVVLAGLPPALVLGLVGTDPPLRGLLAVIAAGTAAAAVVTFARSRIGGFTGDVLGAAGVVGETVGLLLLAVHA